MATFFMVVATACSGTGSLSTTTVGPPVTPTSATTLEPVRSADVADPAARHHSAAEPSTLPPVTTTILIETTTTTVPPAVTSTTPAPVPLPIDELDLGLELVADGFDQPVLLVSPPGDPRLFVVDQPGRIWIIDGPDTLEFLDIRDVVRFRGEQGLFAVAFHPAYSVNGLFYVDFIDDRGDTVLSEFRVDPLDANVALPGSRRDVLRVDQPAANHNGGMIAFGPDGLLWLGLGDGGGTADRYGNGQRADRRLSSMIRIAVGPDNPQPFGEPNDGPFVGQGGLPEVWAIGLRNPWRWTFDDGYLYIADVGQSKNEEINVVPADRGGLNYGWPLLEGAECFRAGSCDEIDRLAPGMPLLTYSHDDGCSVTGGFVYRGSSLPELAGHYFYGDFCAGWVESVLVGEGPSIADRREWFAPGTVSGLTSFGIDASGELYVLTTRGAVHRIVRG